jgi:hypothetical protein
MRSGASSMRARTSRRACVRSQGGLHDPRRARETGRALEEIARGKLYRLAGHRTLDDFVRDALGISRPTAHRLRTIARAPASLEIPRRGKTAPYEAARTLAREAHKPTEPARDETPLAKGEGKEKAAMPARAVAEAPDLIAFGAHGHAARQEREGADDPAASARLLTRLAEVADGSAQDGESGLACRASCPGGREEHVDLRRRRARRGAPA